MSFGTDYTRPASRQRVRGQGGPQDKGMLHRLNTSLTQALYEGGNHDNGAADDFESKSVGQLRQQFATLSPTGTGRSRQSNGSHKRWNQPQTVKYAPAHKHHTDLGWTPFSGKQQQGGWSQRNRQPQRSASPPVNSSVRRQPVRPNTAHELDTPAWAGTLRSSGGPRQWELSQAESIAPASVARQYRQQQPEPVALPAPQQAGGHVPPQPHQPKIQVMHYGPTGQQVYEQHEAPQYGDSESARVVHLQYNTPLGLYSRENVEQALEGQTHDKAGYGTMEVSGGNPGKQFNPQKSSVLRLLAEEEAQKAGGGRGRRAGPSRQSELKQSPIIYALDATYGNGASEHLAGGMSDF